MRTLPAPGTAAATEQSLAYLTRVRRAVNLAPGLRRLVLEGEDLQLFGTGSDPFDLRFKIIVPAEGATTESIGDTLAPILPGAPAVEDSDGMGWYRLWLQAPVSQRGVMRTYTARALRQEDGVPVLDVDLVLHGILPDGSAGEGCGPAAAWATGARVGDELYVVGPNAALCDASYGGIDFRPGPARDLLLAGDETAAPALCSILESLPRDARGHALIEVPEAAQVQEVAAPAGVQVRWLVRELGASVGSLLDPAVRAAAPAWVAGPDGEGQGEFCGEPGVGLDAGLGAGPGAEPEDVNVDEVTLWEAPRSEASAYAWIAGEAAVVKELRRFLVRDLGVDRHRVAFMGYWRRGRAGV